MNADSENIPMLSLSVTCASDQCNKSFKKKIVIVGLRIKKGDEGCQNKILKLRI